MKVMISQFQSKILLDYRVTAAFAKPLIVGVCPVFVEGTEDQLDELRELCADLLPVVGFDRDYVANDVGMALEDLIDKLFSLNAPNIPVDFNAMNEDSSVRLNTRGALEALESDHIALREGMDIVISDGDLSANARVCIRHGIWSAEIVGAVRSGD